MGSGGSGVLQGYFYDRFVRNYDRCVAPLERSVICEARKRLLGRAEGLVLDLGAGTGANFEYFHAPVRRVVAIDSEIRMLLQARDRDRPVPVDILVADAEALPFPSGVFDTVVATLVLCTTPHPDTALAELARVLAPGGRALLLEHVRSTSSIVGFAQDLANPLQRLVAGGCNLNRRTESRLLGAGLQVDRQRSRFAGILVEIEAISVSRT